MDTPTCNVLSVCSGYGGLDLGVELATGGATRVVCHVEREAFAAAILAARMAEEAVAPAPIWSDLRTFDGGPWRGVVDLITGGYPCQPFSHAGKRLGEQDERHLWPDIACLIGEVEPGIVFFENVAGHLTLGFDAVRADLECLGYRVAAGLFSAAEVGASHRRERLFILGVAYSERKRGCGGSAWCKNATAAQAASGSVADFSHDHGRRGVKRDELDLFPPGPGERDRWAAIIAGRPDLAPATQRELRGVADGRASRLDRLRALGNGVVPLVAAYAFVSLWACLFHGEE